jgi:hypothetical protein
MNLPKRIAILSTGGTIEKTYNETDGSLRNVSSILDDILRRLRLPGLTIRHVPVMSKDSLDMTEADRETILAALYGDRQPLFGPRLFDDGPQVGHAPDCLAINRRDQVANPQSRYAIDFFLRVRVQLIWLLVVAVLWAVLDKTNLQFSFRGRQISL